ncbi:hypothetical protein [Salsuginibacillus kocurii]|nr:hypothetical protein [Salsuginibacillus kocurii]
MNRKSKETLMVQLMLGISIILGFIPPLVMYLITKRNHLFYREAVVEH